MDVSGQRGYHVIWYASQIGVTCLGPADGNEQTLVRLDEWAPDPVTRDEADGMRELALRFVQSHGPVTHQDFARWASVGAGVAKTAITANDGLVSPVSVDGRPMWVSGAVDPQPVPDALALPGFDEFILGYKDRSPVLPDEFKTRICPGNNGVFRPTLVVGGQVVGTWRRTRRAKVDVIDVEAFEPLSRRVTRAAEAALQRYSEYLQQEVDVRFA